MTRRLWMLTVASFVAIATTNAAAAAAASPAVVTGAAGAITTSGAVLGGTVNPGGSATVYQFQWGLTASYGLSDTALSAGSGTTALTVHGAISQLIPGTVYHYRLIASNPFGTSVGADRTFATAGHPPAGVVTGSATQIGQTTTVLTGTVNPEGQATSWAFQYGLTPSYSAQTFGATLPASLLASTVNQQLSGIAPGTTFHYRLVAFHGSTIVSFGADQTFFTLPNPRAVPTVHAQTSPRRAHKKPFVFTTTGSITVPGFIPAGLACSGTVDIHYHEGNRTVGDSLAGVGPNCKFSTQVHFRRLLGGQPMQLRVTLRFSGNSYLTPAGARQAFVQLG